jgi:hypothetical protein
MRTFLYAWLVVCPCVALADATPSQDSSRPRFDEIVREDFFAGFAGDREALDRGMRTCSDALKQDPHNAEALAWEAGGFIYLGSQAAHNGDRAQGLTIQDRGYKELDYAVAINPNNIAPLISRGATLLYEDPATAVGKKRLQQGVADYERVLGLSKISFAQQSTHSRGELLNGIADGLARLGERQRARGYFERVTRELPGSKYADVATRWLAGKTDATTKLTCLGCH